MAHAVSKGLTGVGAVVLIGAAAVLMYKQLRGPRLFLEERYVFIGQKVADETARLLNYKGRIVVISFDYKGQPDQVVTETDAFLREIQKRGITVAGVELQDPVALAQGQKFLPGDIYLALVKKYPSVDAFVSFVGPPQLTRSQTAELAPKMPRCVAVSLFSFAGRRLFQDGIIQMAMLPRFEPLGPNVPPPKSDAEWFDHNFQIVHVEEASRLPN